MLSEETITHPNTSNTPSIIVALKKSAEVYGAPDGNISATRIFAQLLRASLENDGIIPERVVGAGYYNSSAYIIEVAPEKMSITTELVTGIVQKYSRAERFWILRRDENGMLDGLDDALDDANLTEATECFEAALRGEIEITHENQQRLEQVLQRLKELEDEARAGDEWKGGDGQG